MTEPTLTRQTFLLQLSCGLAAFAVGCDSGDDSGDDGGATDTDATTDPSGTSTNSGTTTGSPSTSTSGTTDPTDATGPSTTGEVSSSSSGGDDTGSSSSGGDSSGSSTGGEASVCVESIVAAVISNNHGHVLEIPLADIDAGVETSYDASGASDHCHEVVLTAEDFATLRAGGTVVKFSCNGGDHEFVLSCDVATARPGDPECQEQPALGQCP